MSLNEIGRHTFHSCKHTHNHTDTTGVQTPDAGDTPSRSSVHKSTHTHMGTVPNVRLLIAKEKLEKKRGPKRKIVQHENKQSKKLPNTRSKLTTTLNAWAGPKTKQPLTLPRRTPEQTIRGWGTSLDRLEAGKDEVQTDSTGEWCKKGGNQPEPFPEHPPCLSPDLFSDAARLSTEDRQPPVMATCRPASIRGKSNDHRTRKSQWQQWW